MNKTKDINFQKKSKLREVPVRIDDVAQYDLLFDRAWCDCNESTWICDALDFTSSSGDDRYIIIE